MIVYNDESDDDDDDTSQWLRLSQYRNLYHSLLRALCGAYGSASLAQNVRLDGLLDNYGHDDDVGQNCELNRWDGPNPEDVRPCSVCRMICQTFPLPAVIQYLSPLNFEGCCSSINEFWDIVTSRGGTDESAFKDAVIEKFKETLRMSEEDLFYGDRRDADMVRAIQELGERYKAKNDRISLYRDRSLLFLEGAVKHGAGKWCGTLTNEDILKMVFGGAFYSVGGGVPGSVMVLKSSIDRLIDMGVPVVRKDFIVVDDDEEPLLVTFLRGVRDYGMLWDPLS